MCIENRLLLCAYAKKPFYKGLCRRSSNSIHKNIPFGGSASGCVVFCCMSFGLSSEHRDLHRSNFACSITQSVPKCKYLRAFDGGFDFFQQVPDRQMLRTVCLAQTALDTVTRRAVDLDRSAVRNPAWWRCCPSPVPQCSCRKGP